MSQRTDTLLSELRRRLGPEPADLSPLRDGLERLTPQEAETLADLWVELCKTSPKTARACLSSWVRLRETLTPPLQITYVDGTIGLAACSSAAALKYLSESPPALARTPEDKRGWLLNTVLRWAADEEMDHSPLILPLVRTAPDVAPLLEPPDLDRWADTAVRLGNAVLAVEYLQSSPALLGALPEGAAPDPVLSWAAVAPRLVSLNAIGKPDFIPALEWFRTAPENLQRIHPPELRLMVMELCIAASASVPDGESSLIMLDLFKALTQTVPAVSSNDFRRVVLSQMRRLIEKRDFGASRALDHLRQVPEILSDPEVTPELLEAWFEAGLRLASAGHTRTRGPMGGVPRTAKEVLESLKGGVALAPIRRVLTLYAEGLSGRNVRIGSTAETPPEIREAGDRPTTDGHTIYLPDRIRTFADVTDNYRLYRMATLHETAHLEFGTYDVLELPAFPNPDLARVLWHILEDARVDYLLRWRYAGVRRDLDIVITEDLKTRPKPLQLPPAQGIIEALIQLSVADDTEVSVEMAPIVSKAYTLLLLVKRPEAATADSARLLPELYALVEEAIRLHPVSHGDPDPLEFLAKRREWRKEGDQTGGRLEERTNLSYRGEMHLNWVKENKDRGAPLTADSPKSPAEESPAAERYTETPAHPTGAAAVPPSALAAETLFDEWDYRLQEYRPGYCRVRVQTMPEGSEEAAVRFLSGSHGEVRAVRRSFESLRPQGFRTLKRRPYGEDVDLDAMIERIVERKARLHPSDDLYLHRRKQQRDVAAVLLLDMSGSTSRRVAVSGKRIIEIEQEAVLLFCEALDAMGDPHALYAFSGRDHDGVDLRILKEFEERYGAATHKRIGAMQPEAQNRDGAAIRFGLSRLRSQPHRTRLLILVSDGRPLDHGYEGEYGLEDTRMALREAHRDGIHTFCVTVDPALRSGSDYVRRMVGDTQYVIIDDAAALPFRLTEVYRRLTT
jgi:hypothetical protein